MNRSTKLRLRALCAVAAICSLPACFSVGGDSSAIPDEVTPELARASEQARQYDRAVELWGRLHLDSRGQALEPYLGRGRSLLRIGDVRGACAVVEQGIVVFPREPDLYLLYGEILSEANFHRAAERSYESAVSLDGSRHAAQFGLGRVRAELGLSHKALEPLRKALELEPDDLESLRLYARASEDAGLELQAFEARRRLLELERNPTAYRYVTTARLAFHPDVLECYPDALDLAHTWIQRAIELDPQDSEAYYLRACELEMRGRHAEAREALMRAVEIDPGNLQALSELAENHHLYGQVDQADRFARMALDLEQDRRRRAYLETLLLEPR